MKMKTGEDFSAFNSVQKIIFFRILKCNYIKL